MARKSLTDTEGVYEAPRDATRVQYKPTVYVGDSKEVQDAFNAQINAEGNFAYGLLRFAPYIKYVTDALDTVGASPDQEGNIDPTDMMGMLGGHGGSFAFNQIAKDLENQRTNKRVSVGRGRHKHSYIRTPANAQNQAHIFRQMAKYNPLGYAGLLGDIYQEAVNGVNLYNAEKNYNNVIKAAIKAKLPKHNAPAKNYIDILNSNNIKL